MNYLLQKIESWLAHRPILVRRRFLRAAFIFLKIFGRCKPFYAEVVQIAHALRIPISKAHAIAVESIFHDLLFSMEWAALASRSFDELIEDAKHVSVDNSAKIEWCLNNKSMILATLHSGCYHIAIAYLIKTYFPDRKIIIIKNSALTGQELHTIERFLALGFDVKVFTNEAKSEFFNMLRYLRNGAVLFILSDLPKTYGKSTKVEFLDRYAYIADGILDLSSICKAPILFFRVKTDTRGDVIFSDFILNEADQKSNMHRSAMADHIGSFVTNEIRNNPHQWQMWGRLSEYYSEEDLSLLCSSGV